jgi:hypothetical protein
MSDDLAPAVWSGHFSYVANQRLKVYLSSHSREYRDGVSCQCAVSETHHVISRFLLCGPSGCECYARCDIDGRADLGSGRTVCLYLNSPVQSWGPFL